MTWYPIAFLPPQYEDNNGEPYHGAVLKAYAAGTSTVIPMATSFQGVTTASSLMLNSSGYPVSGGAVVIPHVQQDYKLALYPNQTAADNNSGAVWTVDDIKIAQETGAAFVQSFSGDGITNDFVLSEDLGTDERTVMIFADKKFGEYVKNGNFATDSDWTKGAGWSIGSGTANATTASTDLSQPPIAPLIAEESYTLTYTITRSAGDVTPKIGGRSGVTRNAAGTYTETIIANNTQALTFTGNGFTGSVDNVSVHRTTASRREILAPDEFILDGVNLEIIEAPAGGTNNILVFAPSLLFGAVGSLADAAATSEANALIYRNEAQAARDDILNDAGFIVVSSDLLGADTIGIVASNIGSVTTVAGISADVTTVAGISADVTTVAGISANVTTVAGISANVTTVAGNTININTVASISSDVSALAPIANQIEDVGDNITAVVDASTNMAAIIAAPTAATNAANSASSASTARDFAWQWSSQAEDVGVNDGVNPAGFSAYHWSQKAAASAGGIGLSTSVFGVAGNASGARADIQATTNDRVLARTGNALDFVQISNNMIANGAVNFGKMQNVVGPMLLGRTQNTNGAMGGLSITQVLDLVTGTAAQGDIIYRGATTYQRLPTGTAGQVLVTDGTTPSWQNLPSGLPVGTTIEYSGTTLPSGFLAEDGAAVSRTTYANLFTAIGTTHGAGDGSTTFNVPDSRRRTAIGNGGTGTGVIGNAVGNTGGVESVSLVEANNGPHIHQVIHNSVQATGFGFVATGTSTPIPGNSSGSTPATTSSGSGTAHNNVQPSIVKMKCIKF